MIQIAVMRPGAPRARPGHKVPTLPMASGTVQAGPGEQPPGASPGCWAVSPVLTPQFPTQGSPGAGREPAGQRRAGAAVLFSVPREGFESPGAAVLAWLSGGAAMCCPLGAARAPPALPMCPAPPAEAPAGLLTSPGSGYKAQATEHPQHSSSPRRASSRREPLAGGEMFYSGILTEPSRKEVEIREAASLRQQRRMKQAVQFIHKDSADLLPLDGLKKLGTSKDTQPHNILQKRLMETNLSKFRGSRGSWTPKGDLSSQTNKLNQTKLGSSGKTEDEELIAVSCQCAGKELKAVVDTGSQHNLMSSACLDRLGLKEHLKALPVEDEMVSLPNKVKAIGQIECLSLTVGAVPVECAALVVEDNEQPFSFGLQTLKSLKCVINMEKHHLVLGQMDREEIPFVSTDSAEAGEHSLEA
uniref:Nuclear receptor interacting protein 3 n=2 Tax=Cyanistes caeruleus TaxID=156563 RepID=A0A8C0V4V6_CYACU